MSNGLLALTAFILGQFFVPLSQRVGRWAGIVDAVNPLKIHSEPKVRCGGLGIYLAFIGTLTLAMAAINMSYFRDSMPAVLRSHLPNVGSVTKQLAAIAGGATFLFLVGLTDDKFNLQPLVKLALQILSAVPLIVAGVTIKSFLPGEWTGALLTVAWVVLVTNSFNFLDNMNGLSSGIACVCAVNLYLVSRFGHEYFMMALIAVFAGAVAGFLRFNFPNARLFMGDSGSLFIGYMIAALSIKVTYYQAGVPTQIPVVAPLVILGVPLFDTASVMFIRWKNGKPLMQGDQNHFSHRLVSLGFTRVRAVMFIWLVTLSVGLSAVNLRYLAWSGAVLALIQVVLFFVIIYFLESVGRAKIQSNGQE
jgi:UDP-GlcNAc:undecaprenyl-phosphate/decaprenyl-phosphate GlcNAc-1-phosphate transferase